MSRVCPTESLTGYWKEAEVQPEGMVKLLQDCNQNWWDRYSSRVQNGSKLINGIDRWGECHQNEKWRWSDSENGNGGGGDTKWMVSREAWFVESERLAWLSIGEAGEGKEGMRAKDGTWCELPAKWIVSHYLYRSINMGRLRWGELLVAQSVGQLVRMVSVRRLFLGNCEQISIHQSYGSLDRPETDSTQALADQCV